MADQSGRKISVGVAKEATRGTAVIPAYWLPQLAIDFQNKSKQILNTTALGVLNKNNASELVEDWAEGKIDGKVTDKAFGLILLAAFGTDTPALHTGETIVYDHTYGQSQTNTPQSLTITRKDTNGDKQYALAMLKTLEIDVVVGDFVKYTSHWVSKKGAAGTDTVAYSLENEFKPKYATVKLAANTAGLGAAVAVPLKSFKLTLTRTLNPYFVFGSNDPGEIFVEDLTVTGDFVLRYTDSTYETLFFANTPQAVQLDLKNTDVTIGAATNPELKITLPKVALSDWKIDQSIDKMTEQTIGMQGLYDTVSAAEITGVLTNLVASY